MKVGDRVIRKEDGQIGTVLQIGNRLSSFREVCVEYDNWKHGHDGNGLLWGRRVGKPYSCWWENPNNLEVIPAIDEKGWRAI